ncbi:hypothetical protein ACIHBQ_20610 [Streptomyces sp. NPDC052492]|uniref:hypothetical protein n=1 Tax=Streptomyces sp. NPDC052492 TaxID=3365691 RepID=UPI0037D2F01D
MRAIAPFEADPHAVICELVAAVEPELSPETVKQAIQHAVASKSAAVRLAQALEGGLLTSGRAEGPASVERFIRNLQEFGAVNVVWPPCSRCGKLRPLTNTNGAGLRVVCLMWQQQQDERLGLRGLRQQRHSALRARSHGPRGMPLVFQGRMHRGPGQ